MNKAPCSKGAVLEPDMNLAKIHEWDDAGLVALAQGGERRALSELVHRHHAPIYRVCFGILQDTNDAADATQDAFIRAFNKLDTVHHHSHFKTWMTCVAVNVSLNIREQQRPGVPWDDMVDGTPQVMGLAIDREKDFIEVPRVAGPGTPSP